MPVGLSFVGRRYDDRRVIAAAGLAGSLWAKGGRITAELITDDLRDGVTGHRSSSVFTPRRPPWATSCVDGRGR